MSDRFSGSGAVRLWVVSGDRGGTDRTNRAVRAAHQCGTPNYDLAMVGPVHGAGTLLAVAVRVKGVNRPSCPPWQFGYDGWGRNRLFVQGEAHERKSH